MSVEQQIHKALIRANFLKDKDPELGFAWIANAMACNYTELQIELIGLHSDYHATGEKITVNEAVELWARLTGKKNTVDNFIEKKCWAQRNGFEITTTSEKVPTETKRGAGRPKLTIYYEPASIYRLAQFCLK